MKVSRDFGIVVRRAALAAKNVDLSPVMTEFNLARYFDESEIWYRLVLSSEAMQPTNA
ncbi:hypothetical protein C7S14_0204 [Burkholderia cepacia]|nr:hypothetical protein C7S14_0204 [Burkholderia cepacia]